MSRRVFLKETNIKGAEVGRLPSPTWAGLNASVEHLNRTKGWVRGASLCLPDCLQVGTLVISCLQTISDCSWHRCCLRSLDRDWNCTMESPESPTCQLQIWEFLSVHTQLPVAYNKQLYKCMVCPTGSVSIGNSDSANCPASIGKLSLSVSWSSQLSQT